VNKRNRPQGNAPYLGLILSALAMAVVPGSIGDAPNAVVSNLASDLARQIVTWWLL
jgi:hypothetical protein